MGEQQEIVMGEIKDKAKGAANEAVGRVKQAAGKAAGNPNLRNEGSVQEAKGQLQKAKGAIKGAINKL